MKHNYQETIWIEGLQSGSKSAFREIYDQYRDKLYTFSLRLTKDEAAAEEIVHAVFLKVWNNRTAINTDLCFNAFLFKITKNEAINYLRKVARDENLKAKLYHYFEQFDNQTEDAVIYADYMQLMKSAIEQLPPQRKLIFNMHKMDGMSYKEIADVLHISKGTVKNHMILSLKFLKSYLTSNTDITFVYFWLLEMAIIDL